MLLRNNFTPMNIHNRNAYMCALRHMYKNAHGHYPEKALIRAPLLHDIKISSASHLLLQLISGRLWLLQVQSV